jgi:importin-5
VKFSMHMIDRMIAAMEDDKTIEVVSIVISDLVRNDDWRCRHAALMALSQVGEYIEDLNQLKEIVIFILNYAYDSHPKVRYAFLHAIGQIADDMHPDFQERFHEQVIPLLLKTLNDSVPRVVAHAFAALTNFLEGCKRPHIINRIKEILEPSLYAIRNCISIIKENAMSTISALAEAANNELKSYWEETAGIVFEILKNATQPEYKQLRGQAIECLTLIGSAVGRDEFAKGAKEIIFTMLQIQKNYIEDSDPQKSYLLSGWQRICIILQEDFVPFMDEILPSLFDLVERVIKLDKDRRDNRDKQDAEKVQQAFEKPKRKFNANTSESDDLQISLNMINVFITYLKKGYLSYVERTINIMSPMLNYSISEDIRTTAAKALPGLVTVLKMSGREDANDLVRKASLSFIEQIWKTMNTEYESKVMSMFVYAIREIIVAAGDRAFTQEEIISLGNGFFQALKESEERRVEKEKLFEGDEDDLDEDEDGYDEDEDPEMEEEFMLSIAAAIGALFSTHKELAYPIFETIYKTILPNVFQEGKNYKTYMFGLHLIDDIIEHLGTDLIQNELGELINALIKFTKHETPQVRKAASFGIGVFSEKSSENAFNTYSKECLTAIYESYHIQRTEDDDERLFNDAKDHATIALGKIIRFRSQELSQVINDIIKLWVTHLPLRSNKEEARVQHEMLLDIITSANANLVFGAKGEQLPHVFRIFALIVDTKFSTDTVKKKIQALLTVFASNETSKNVLVQVIEAMPNDLQQKLKRVLEQ